MDENSTLPESDLTIQSDGKIYQFQYIDSDEASQRKVKLKKGIYSLANSAAGLTFVKTELRTYDLLESIDNTEIIMSEYKKLFHRIQVYKDLKRPEIKRSILLYSIPGVGKTSSINRVCNFSIEEDEGTAVVIWDTSAIRAASVNSLFQNELVFDKSVTRLIFVIEDIDGGSVEDSYGPRGAQSSLLNLLDGAGSSFKNVPTFVIATTNNPEQSVAALIDRPGRFDKVIELHPPNVRESQELLSFISKRDLTDEEKEAAKLAAKNKFSIAHLQEVVIRSILDETTFLDVVKQLVDHKEKFKNSFQEAKHMGFGLGD